MGWLKKVFSIFGTRTNDRNLWFYVKCENCDEMLKGRLDLQNDLSLIFNDNTKKSGYYCRKVLIGSNRCYLPIEVEFNFDPNRNLLSRQIQGGTFVEVEDYRNFINKGK